MKCPSAILVALLAVASSVPAQGVAPKDGDGTSVVRPCDLLTGAEKARCVRSARETARSQQADAESAWSAGQAAEPTNRRAQTTSKAPEGAPERRPEADATASK